MSPDLCGFSLSGNIGPICLLERGHAGPHRALPDPGYQPANVDVAEFADLQEAVRQLHDFIVDQLDPDPSAVEDYISDKGAQAAARRAMEARPMRYLGLVDPSEDSD